MVFDLNHNVNGASDDLKMVGDNKRHFVWNMAEIGS